MDYLDSLKVNGKTVLPLLVEFNVLKFYNIVRLLWKDVTVTWMNLSNYSTRIMN